MRILQYLIYRSAALYSGSVFIIGGEAKKLNRHLEIFADFF